MSLPLSWVEKIFEKLSLTYGRDFLARWDGLALDKVQSDWAKELGTLFQHPDAINFALSNLPAKPPTVVEFKKLAREFRPAEKPPQIEIGLKRDPVRLQEALRLMTQRAQTPNRRQWAYDLIARHDSGDHRPVACLRMAREAIAADRGLPLGEWGEEA